MKNERDDQLRGLIQNGQIAQAIEMVRSAKGCEEGESFVTAVLWEEKSTPELTEAVLEAFLNTRENLSPKHGYWVHSLSHFTELLWERRIDRWIKNFNEVSFRGAKELLDSNCCARLVSDFDRFAKFDDNPADFHLTPDNLQWVDLRYATAYFKERIKAGRFESEEAFLRWKLHLPEAITHFDFNTKTNLVNLKGIRALVQRLHELGADTSEFNGLERDMLTKQLSELEEKLPAATQDWQRQRLEEEIQRTRAALA